MGGLGALTATCNDQNAARATRTRSRSSRSSTSPAAGQRRPPRGQRRRRDRSPPTDRGVAGIGGSNTFMFHIERRAQNAIIQGGVRQDGAARARRPAACSASSRRSSVARWTVRHRPNAAGAARTRSPAGSRSAGSCSGSWSAAGRAGTRSVLRSRPRAARPGRPGSPRAPPRRVAHFAAVPGAAVALLERAARTCPVEPPQVLLEVPEAAVGEAAGPDPSSCRSAASEALTGIAAAHSRGYSASQIAGPGPASITPSRSRSSRLEPAARHASSSASIRAARGLGAGARAAATVSTGVNATLRRSCVAAAFIAEVTDARSCCRAGEPVVSIRTRWTSRSPSCRRPRPSPAPGGCSSSRAGRGRVDWYGRLDGARKPCHSYSPVPFVGSRGSTRGSRTGSLPGRVHRDVAIVGVADVERERRGRHRARNVSAERTLPIVRSRNASCQRMSWPKLARLRETATVGRRPSRSP